MSSSNDNKTPRRPIPSPVHRKRHLDPGLETNHKRRETDRSMNARFDRMVDTMSVMYSRPESPRYASKKRRKRSGRSYSLMNDAYSLPTPAHLKNGLSFVKMDGTTSSSPVFGDARHSHSSGSVEVSRGSIRLRSPCNPLPGWLANTFMSLSKKHPLRLLLPSDAVQAIPEGPSDNTLEGTEDGIFGFMNLPTPKYDSPDEHANPEIHKVPSCTNAAVVAGVLLDSDPDPLPFSTPGPGSCLAGKSTLSTASLQTSSSPTLFDTEGHLPDHKSSRQFINQPSSTTLSGIHHCDGLQIDELYSHADNPYLSQIYATPGPRYLASGIEDPLPLELESDATPSRLNTDDDLIDFRWQPFDRKRLVVPMLTKAPAFADDGRSAVINAPLAALQTPDASKLEALTPFSPSPFSFSPLDLGEAVVSAIDPESHDPSKDMIMKTPPLQVRSATLAICRAPLSLPVGRTSGSLSAAERGIFKGKELPRGKGSKHAITEDLFTFLDGPDFGLSSLGGGTTECD